MAITDLLVPNVVDKVVGTAAGAVDAIIKRFIPDPLAAAQASLAAQAAIREADYKDASLAASTIVAEASSGNWLAAAWRPITMLVFVSLIAARWFGLAAEGMTEAEYLEVYGLIKVGLGGYVAGRSIEKVAPSIVSALKK